ncbi:MAG: c-type cytochrome [Candidatus Sulfotelmatobacter sp.]
MKHVPITPTPATSGKEMLIHDCAVCHGKNGKGSSPAASAVKLPPPDLATLGERNGGRFPSAHVSPVVRGQAQMQLTVAKDMPVWGPLFSSISRGHESEVQQRVTNPVDYIETLQAK